MNVMNSIIVITIIYFDSHFWVNFYVCFAAVCVCVFRSFHFDDDSDFGLSISGESQIFGGHMLVFAINNRKICDQDYIRSVGRLVVDDDDDDVDNFDVRVSHTTLWHALVMTISINYAMAIQGLSMFSLFSRHRPKMWLLYEFDYFPAYFPPDNRHIAPWCTENLDADQMRPDRESRDFADFYQNKPLLGLCIFTRRHIKNVRQDRYTNDIECEKPVDIKREKPK